MLEKKNDQFCLKLWREVFLEYNGNVHACCYRNPAIFGNIYNNRIEDIFNNEILKQYRRLALAGELPCFKTCTVRHNYHLRFQTHNNPGVFDSVIADYHQLDVLKIAMGMVCNIRCIMCPQDHTIKETLDVDALLKNVDLNFFKQIVLQGGEPLVIKGVKKLFDHAAAKGAKVSFVTNGILIDDSWAKRIAGNSKYIHISLNAATKKTHELVNKGSSWTLLLDNIQRIRDYKEKKGTDVEIIGHMTIIPENIIEIPQFIRDYKKNGFDTIQFGFDKAVPNFLKANSSLKTKIKNELSTISELANIINVDTHRLKILNLV